MKDRIKICSWVKRSPCRIKSSRKKKHSGSSSGLRKVRRLSKSFGRSKKIRRHSRRHSSKVVRRSKSTIEVYNKKRVGYVIPLLLFLFLLGAGYIMCDKNGNTIKSSEANSYINSNTKQEKLNTFAEKFDNKQSEVISNINSNMKQKEMNDGSKSSNETLTGCKGLESVNISANSCDEYRIDEMKLVRVKKCNEPCI